MTDRPDETENERGPNQRLAVVASLRPSSRDEAAELVAKGRHTISAKPGSKVTVSSSPPTLRSSSSRDRESKASPAISSTIPPALRHSAPGGHYSIAPRRSLGRSSTGTAPPAESASWPIVLGAAVG